MATYDYVQWKDRISSYLEKFSENEVCKPEVIIGLLKENEKLLDQSKDDYISIIVGLTVISLKQYAIQDYILERFQQLYSEKFDGYIYAADPQFQEDQVYLLGLNSRNVFDQTINNKKQIVRQVDQICARYESKSSEQKLKERKGRIADARLFAITFLVVAVIFGVLIWIGMRNQTAGIILLALLCITVFTLAMKKHKT